VEKSPRVFIVDQDQDARFQLQQLVRQVGFAAAGQAGLGTEAVALVTELKPDIVLCGLREPVARVVQTVESIVHALPETPVVVYAQSGELETIRKAMLAGARDFLLAPLKPEDLKRSLTALLELGERRKRRDAGSQMLGPHGAIITVFGAKGGVGKTTIAANLAVALVRNAGQSVVLVDADDTFGDAAAMLELLPERTVADGLRAAHAVDGESAKDFLTLHPSGLAVVSTPASPLEWKGVTGEPVQRMLYRLARQFDIVLVDTAGTLSDVSQAALEAGSLVLWVTTPEYASVRDSLQALNTLRGLQLPQDRIRLVLNAVYPEVEISAASIEDALGHPIFWTVPHDRNLRRFAQLGRAVVETQPNSPAARNIIDLALVLAGAPRKARTGGFLHRFRNGRVQRNAKRQPENAPEGATS